MNFELTIDNILLLILAIAGFLQLFYFLFFFLRLSFKDKNKGAGKVLPVSVVIAARNEENNLVEFLPLILEQEYEKFEVIVVNDRSWDESLDVLLAFEQKYKHLRIVDIPDVGKDGFAKKMALTLGIKAAQYDYLLFTDADCKPVSNQWISEMVKGFSKGKRIVLGAGGYIKQKGLLNRFIRFDASFIAVQYLSFAKAGMPYMGVGRNLAYTKELYDSVRGFKSHYHLPSGDDDLLVNEAGDCKNTSVVFNEKAITLSVPKNSYKSWKWQKARHFTTGGMYKWYQILLLSLYPLSLVLFYVSAGVLLSKGIYFNEVLIAILVRILLQFTIFYKPFKIMQSRDLVILSPILEIIFIFINPLLILSSRKSKQF